MKLFLRICVCVAILFATTGVSATGQTFGEKDIVPESRHVSILFRFDNAEVDESYMNNAQALRVLHNVMSNEAVMSTLDSIVVTASSSPEGTYAYNMRLAQRRADALKAYIVKKYPFIKADAVRAYPCTDYWSEMIEMVEADPNVPSKDAFLEMLDNPNLTNDQKSWRMRTMLDGVVFAYLNKKGGILDRLRGSGTDIEFHSPVLRIAPEPEPIPEPEPQPEPILEPEPQPEPIPEPQPQPEPGRGFTMALRTNLLLDLAGGPNLAMEFPIGNRLSIAGDFAYAYTRIDNLYALQTKQVSLEGRYWFNRGKNLLTGWNLGVYGTYCDRFDIQWKDGWQGDSFWSAGLVGGYSWRLSNSFNIDLSVAGGVVFISEMRHYTRPQDGHLMWQETIYNATRFLPTQVRVNLVWLIGAKKKR